MRLCSRFFPTFALCLSILCAAYLYGRRVDTSVTSLDDLRTLRNQAEAYSSPSVTQPRNASLYEALHKPPRDLLDAIASFVKYKDLARSIISRKQQRFGRLSSRHRALADAIGYTSHFETAKRGIERNDEFARQIALFARERYRSSVEMEEDSDTSVDFGLVDKAFGHLSRDWSEQGRPERAHVFPPILDALKAEFTKTEGKTVLVPGSGLGRLAHEIANEGFNVDACEYDYSSILAYSFLVNQTTRVFEHTLQPFITKWTHQLNPAARFQPITFPDILPNPSVKLVEGDFLLLFPESEAYDAIVTLFFIDISENIIDFLENIHRLLKPGGLWVNLGPMKWGTHTQMQLSAEEVLQLAELLGFDVRYKSRKSIESVYADQPETLLKYTYITQFWTAQKL